jgi:protein-tyrosine-phosphatase
MQSAIPELLMPSVLFVCTANRFRSPLAAALLTQALEELGFAKYWQVGSAGTWALPGQPALPRAVSVARRFGIDLSKHCSLRINRQILSGYDLTLVMQASHREALWTEFPDLKERIYLFSDVAERRYYDIPDSFESEQSVMDISTELHGLIRRGLDKICMLAAHLRNVRERAGS